MFCFMTGTSLSVLVVQGWGRAGKEGRGQMTLWGLLLTANLWPLSPFLLWDFNLSGIGCEGNEAGQEPSGDFWSVSGMEWVQFLNQAGTGRAGPHWGAARRGCWGGDRHWLQWARSGPKESEDLGAAEDMPQTVGEEGNFGMCWRKSKVRGQGKVYDTGCIGAGPQRKSRCFSMGQKFQHVGSLSVRAKSSDEKPTIKQKAQSHHQFRDLHSCSTYTLNL